MSYKTGEAAAAALIQSIAGWSANNCLSTANDTTNSAAGLLNSGRSDRYCVLRPGAFESEVASGDATFALHRWQTLIDLIVLANPISGESPECLLTGLRQTLLNTLDAHFRLASSGVSAAKVTGGGPIENDTTATASPFIRQRLTLVWEEESTVVQGD
jgi:hypothetical protein